MGFFDDAVSFVSQVATNTWQAGGQLVDSVTHGVVDVASGGGLAAVGDKVSKRFNQGVGAYGTLAGGSFLQTDFAQRVGNDKGWNNATLGIAGDASGYGNFLRTSRETGDYNQDDLNSTLRLTGKAIAIGAGAGQYNSEGLGLSEVGGITSGSTATAASGWSSWTVGGILGGATLAKSVIDKGAGATAQNYLSDATGGVVPRAPEDRLPPLGGRLPASGTAAPTVSSPWNFADSGLSGGAGSNVNQMLLLGSAAVLAAVLVARLKK